MRNSLTLLPAFLLLAACSADDFIGPDQPVQPEDTKAEEPMPIVLDGFGSNAQAATRVGGKTAADLLGGSFRIYATTPLGVEFNNYQVRWEGLDDLTPTNRVGWEYQGYMSKAQPAALQYTKFWNLSVPRYDFVAFAGLADDVLIQSVSSNTIALTPENLDQVYVANRVSAAPMHADAVPGVSPDMTEYGQPVKFTFRRASARMRIGFYETIGGYAVTDLRFYFDDNADAPAGTSTKSEVGLQGKFPTGGQYTVTYGTDNVAHLTYAPEGPTANGHSFGQLRYGLSESIDEGGHYIRHDGTMDAFGEEAFLGISSSTATYAVSDEVIEGATVTASEWHPIFPYEENTATLRLRADYTLVALDGTGGIIHIKDAKAEVPVNYCQWKPNHAYTYLFKISSASAGLYPITFDAVVVEDNMIFVPEFGI